MINSKIKHCYSCGSLALTEFTEGKNRKVCSLCHLVLYENPNPASSVLYIKDNKVLLAKRALDPQKNLWALPGGYQEMEETPEQAARREMYEETGLKASKLELFDLVYNDFLSEKPVNVAVYLVREAHGILEAGDDVSEVAFFSFNELPNPLAFNYIYDCINRAFAADLTTA